MFNLGTLNNLLQKHYEEKEKKDNKIILEYDEYVSERIQDIKGYLDTNKHIVIGAPTGGGKTRAIAKLMNEYPTCLNVILTPSVIQNKQNKKSYGKEFNIQSFTGNDIIIMSSSISATYDKSNTIIEYLKRKDIKLNLFIDECHLMVEASNYRMKAINSMIELSKLADKVIYMSATLDNIRPLLEYDVEIELKPKEQPNNYSNAQVIYFDPKGAEASLVNYIFRYAKSSDRKSILFLDNLEQLETIKEILINKGFLDDEIAVISSKNKDSKAYEEIVNLSKIDDNTKLILTTSVLEVGTNINTDNMNVFLYIPKSNQLNFISIEQKIARIRRCGNNFLKICLVNREKEENYIIDENTIKKDIEYKGSNIVNLINNILDTQYLEASESEKIKAIEYFLNAPKSLYKLSDTLGMNIIDIADCRAVINPYKLQRKASQIYNSQFYYNKEKLKEKLTGIVKTDIWLDDVFTVFEDIKEEFKEVQQIKKETKKELNENIKESFKEIKQNGLEPIAIDKILDPELNTQVCMIEEMYELIENTHIPKIVSKGCKLQVSAEELVNSISINGNSLIKNNRYFLQNVYMKLNRALPIGSSITLEKIPLKEFVYTRNIFDGVCKKQGRIPINKKISLAMQLIELNYITGYTISKGNIYYKDKPITKDKLDKLISPLIESIYNLCDNNKMISSLKTK